MHRPMLIPKSLCTFRHPHIGKPYYGNLADPTGLYCMTDRPYVDPYLIRYWRGIGENSIVVCLPCGEVVRWELPDA